MPVHTEITLAVLSRYDPSHTGVLADPGDAELAAGHAAANILEEERLEANILDTLAKALASSLAAASQATKLGTPDTTLQAQNVQNDKVIRAILACRGACHATTELLRVAGPLIKAVECANVTTCRDTCNACISEINQVANPPATLVAYRDNLVIPCRDKCNVLIGPAPTGLGC